MKGKFFSGNLKQRFYQKRWSLFALAVFVMALLLVTQNVLPNYFAVYYDQTGCLSHRFYFWHKWQKQTIERGDTIFGKAVHMQPFVADGETIGKQVIGIAGDTVEIKNGIVKINGKQIGDVVYGAKRLKLPITHWDKVYTLKHGELFLYGTSKKSYDSRYWGVYQESHVYGIVRPIF
ncbi:MAG: S26 family signal peptidase [Neisseriaceae bacterium]|nr:S26 family signal peptidase [Neisseriaceae bacterium]